MSNTRNYMAHGGDELVIGGKLTFLPGATVEGADGLFLAGKVLFGIHYNRHGGGNALVARTAVAHHRHRSTAHAGIACCRGVRQYPRECAVAHNLTLAFRVECAAYMMAVRVHQGPFSCSLVELPCLEHKTDFVERSAHGKIPHYAHR